MCWLQKCGKLWLMADPSGERSLGAQRFSEKVGLHRWSELDAPIPAPAQADMAQLSEFASQTFPVGAACGVSPRTATEPYAALLATMRVTPKMDPQNVVLKQTVNLPTTAFSMKANLPQAEPRMLARWEEEKLYQIGRAHV